MVWCEGGRGERLRGGLGEEGVREEGWCVWGVK